LWLCICVSAVLGVPPQNVEVENGKIWGFSPTKGHTKNRFR